MNEYDKKVHKQLNRWKKKMRKKPSLINKFNKGIQRKVNNYIPQQIHNIITNTIKNITKAVLIGSKYTTNNNIIYSSLESREKQIRKKFKMYKKTATISGAAIGFGGFAIGLADLPVLLSIKMKYLFEVANIYGFDVKNYKERLFILHVFELAFCSHEKRIKVYEKIKNWEEYSESMSLSMECFNWEDFQQEYRDYIDLAKILQLLPAVGSVVGACANYKLMNKLHITAVNAYRMRIMK